MKILIIGLGSIAKKHIAALSELDSTIQLVALRSSPNAKPYKNVLNIFDFNDIENTLFDFTIISSPTANHKSDIEKLIALKIPLFIEKPLYHNLELNELITKIDQTKTQTYIACNLRFLEALNFTKSYLEDNKHLKINEVNVYCGSYLPEWRETADYKQSYSANQEMGGGVHLDLIHEIDYTYWFFGEPKNISSCLKSNSSLNIKSIDYGHYNLDYDDFMVNITLNYYRREPKRTLEILFNTHTLTVNLLKNEVYAGDELVFKSEQKPIDTYKKQLEYFINNISKPNFNDIHEAYKVLKICLNNQR